MEEQLPEWAERVAGPNEYVVGSQLCTKDGRTCGNAVIIDLRQHGFEDLVFYRVVTDAGNVMNCTEGELKGYFHPPLYIMKSEEISRIQRKIEMEDMKQTPFQIGQVVALASSPFMYMTVNSVRDGSVKCVYFDDDSKLHMSEFREEVLVPITLDNYGNRIYEVNEAPEPESQEEPQSAGSFLDELVSILRQVEPRHSDEARRFREATDNFDHESKINVRFVGPDGPIDPEEGMQILRAILQE